MILNIFLFIPTLKTAERIPDVILNESPTLQMYLALHNDDLGNLNKNISKFQLKLRNIF